MQAPSQSPLFLAGTDRSGIGLLGELLDAHPEVSISRRTNFFSFYYERYGDLSDPENLQRCISDMLAFRRIRDLEPDGELLREQFREGEPTYARLFALIHEQHIARIGKSRWGDKSLNSERHAGKILEAYPTARIVHILRDPRDRYASQATHRGASRGGVGAGTALWNWSARLADRGSRRHTGQYLVVHYETLVQEPEETLRSICAFVDIEYTPEMFRDVDVQRSSSGVQLDPGSIGRYQRDLSAAEIAFIQLWAGRRMRRHGYEPVPSGLSGFRRLLFWIRDLPVYTAGLALWAPNAALKELTGRSPSRRRIVDPEDE